MGLFSRRRPAVAVVVAEANFDGELNLVSTDAARVDLPAGHDLILQVNYSVIDTPDDEHWRIHFRAGIGPEGDPKGPAVFDLADRQQREDGGSGKLEQRLRLPVGTHTVSFHVEAIYNVDAVMEDGAASTMSGSEEADLHGTIRVTL